MQYSCNKPLTSPVITYYKQHTCKKTQKKQQKNPTCAFLWKLLTVTLKKNEDLIILVLPVPWIWTNFGSCKQKTFSWRKLCEWSTMQGFGCTSNKILDYQLIGSTCFWNNLNSTTICHNTAVICSDKYLLSQLNYKYCRNYRDKNYYNVVVETKWIVLMRL